MIAPATSAMIPVSRAAHAPAGMTRSAVIAAVIMIIMLEFIRPATSRTAIGATQLSVQSTPSLRPSRVAVMNPVEMRAGVHE